MIAKLVVTTLALTIPATLTAATPSTTHEIVTVPGKAIVHVRPLSQQQARSVNCHPDASKAATCEAHARVARADQLARAKAENGTRLTQR